MVNDSTWNEDGRPNTPGSVTTTAQGSEEEKLGEGAEGVRPGEREPQADDAELGEEDDKGGSKPAPAPQPIPSRVGSEDPTPSEKSADE